MNRNDPAIDSGTARELAHWMRDEEASVLRVCRGLLDQEHDARDAVQATFLKALERADSLRDPKAARAWLLRIAVNEARDRRRGYRFRAVRQPGLDWPAKELPVAQLVQRGEDSTRLRRAVRGLDPELREPLILRYWEELSLEQIADVLGVASSTVHDRLGRAVDALRSRLGHGRRAALGWPLIFGWRGGGTLMAMKSSSVAWGTILMIVLGFVTWWFGVMDRDEVAPAIPTSTRSHDAGDRAGPDSATGSVQANGSGPAIETAAFASDAAERAAGWVLNGRLMTSTGDPLPQGIVRAILWRGFADDGYEPSPPPERQRLLVDGQGRYRLRVPNRRELQTLQLFGEAEGFARSSWRCVLQPGERNEEERVLRLEPLNGLIIGTVFDTTGRAVPWAQLRCLGESATGDAQGRYRLAVPYRGGRAKKVTAWAPGHGAQELQVPAVSEGEAVTLDFTLGPGIDVYGKVVDEDGRPLAGVKVHSHDSGGREVFTDEDGGFVMEGMSLGKTQMLYFMSADYPITRRRVRAEEPGRIDLEVVLERGVALSGTVRDSDGKPLAGTKVSLGHSWAVFGIPKAISGPEGNFKLPPVEPGKHNLYAQCEGFAILASAIEAPETLNEDDDLELVLERGQQLAGQVRTEDGQPAAGIFISVGKSQHDFQLLNTKTDDDGHFSLGGVPEGAVHISAYRKGYARLNQTVQAGTMDLALVIGRTGILSGRVLDGRNGLPLERFHVRLIQPHCEVGERPSYGYAASLGVTGLTCTEPNGIWRIETEGFPLGGLYAVEISAPGFAPAQLLRLFAELKPDPHLHEVRLLPVGRVKGRVLAKGAKTPVAGAKVVWRTAAEFQARASRQSGIAIETFLIDSPSTPCQTDAAGRFQFADLPEEPVVFLVQSAGPPFKSRTITVPSGSEKVVDLELPSGGEVRGRLTDSRGAPLVDAPIELYFSDRDGALAPANRELLTGPEGRFVVRGLGPGKWTVCWVEKEGHVRAYRLTADVVVREGESHEVQLVCGGDAEIKVQIEGAPPAMLGGWVSATLEGAEEGVHSDTQRTGLVRGGKTSLPGLLPGTWRLLFSYHRGASSEAWTGTAEVTIAPGETRTVTIQAREAAR